MLTRSQKLSAHFTLGELLVSRDHPKLAAQLDPDADAVIALVRLANLVLEPLREAAGRPLVVLSGFRSAALNRAVGGSAGSDHLAGLAADIAVKSDAEGRRLVQYAAVHARQAICYPGRNFIHVAVRGIGDRRAASVLESRGGNYTSIA